jgi:hypothetical protein
MHSFCKWNIMIMDTRADTRISSAFYETNQHFVTEAQLLVLPQYYHLSQAKLELPALWAQEIMYTSSMSLSEQPLLKKKMLPVNEYIRQTFKYLTFSYFQRFETILRSVTLKFPNGRYYSKKVKLSMCLTKHYVMKTYGRVKV